MNYRDLITKSLYFSGKQSIADLSRSIGRSIPSINNCIQQLLQEEIIISTGFASSTGGRRPSEYVLNVPKLPYILAIAIDQHSLAISLMDLSNRIIKGALLEPIDLHSESNLDKKILGLSDIYLSNHATIAISAIGITMPGFVNAAEGTNSSFTESHPLFDIKGKVERHFNLPTFIENDSAAIAIAEHKFGAARSSADVLIVNLNWGIGLGMILKNELFRGHTGFAGEFSHIPVSDRNKLCSCGKRGCLEVEASLRAALEYAHSKLASGETSQLSQLFQRTNNVTLDQLFEAAINGDQTAIESFAQVSYMLGKGIATLIHLINPEKIIISGRGAKIGQILLPQIQASILEFSINRLSKYTSIEISSLENVQAIGSVCIAVLGLKGEFQKQKLPETVLI
ncbi:MAG: mlc 1 [Sphingobacterium sp.]|jgi:predicted NBD/HSP70 family sugar kinase|nr:mlc 1 [Sphingobacterium sp.]